RCRRVVKADARSGSFARFLRTCDHFATEAISAPRLLSAEYKMNHSRCTGDWGRHGGTKAHRRAGKSSDDSRPTPVPFDLPDAPTTEDRQMLRCSVTIALTVTT